MKIKKIISFFTLLSWVIAIVLYVLKKKKQEEMQKCGNYKGMCCGPCCPAAEGIQREDAEGKEEADIGTPYAASASDPNPDNAEKPESEQNCCYTVSTSEEAPEHTHRWCEGEKMTEDYSDPEDVTHAHAIDENQNQALSAGEIPHTHKLKE